MQETLAGYVAEHLRETCERDLAEYSDETNIMGIHVLIEDAAGVEIAIAGAGFSIPVPPLLTMRIFAMVKI